MTMTNLDALSTLALIERLKAAEAVVEAALYVRNTFTDEDRPHLDECQDMRLQELGDALDAYDSQQNDDHKEAGK